MTYICINSRIGQIGEWINSDRKFEIKRDFTFLKTILKYVHGFGSFSRYLIPRSQEMKIGSLKLYKVMMEVRLHYQQLFV